MSDTCRYCFKEITKGPDDDFGAADAAETCPSCGGSAAQKGVVSRCVSCGHSWLNGA